MPAIQLHICFIALSLCLVLTGCGSTQTFLQESGDAYKRGEKIEWVDEPSAQPTNWTTYMDMEGG